MYAKGIEFRGDSLSCIVIMKGDEWGCIFKLLKITDFLNRTFMNAGIIT